MQRERSAGTLGQWAAIAGCAIAVLAVVPVLLADGPTAANTAARIRETGRIRLGYRADARPFSYRSDSGQPAGYSATLCQMVADRIAKELQLSRVQTEWLPVTVDNRFRALADGNIDLLCGAETVTLTRRTEVAFSVPVFPGGVGAMVRADAPVGLREVLSGRAQPYHPTWRASASQLLQAKAFSVVAGTTAAKFVADRSSELHIVADVAPVNSYEAGIRRLLDRNSDVFFGERAILLDSIRRNAMGRDLVVVDRLFTYEPLAFALARGDEDFRLLVDRALSGIYRSGEIRTVYTRWFGEPDDSAVTFFRWNALAE